MSNDLNEIGSLENQLTKAFELKKLDEPKRCLGMEFERNESCFRIGQGAYVRSILKRFGMSECNPVSMPMNPGVRLTKQDKWKVTDGKKPPYREIIDCLLYLARATRPHISHAVSTPSQFNDGFGRSHWEAAKRVFRYLKGSPDVYIKYDINAPGLSGYVDAD